MSHVAALHLYRIKLGTKLIRSYAYCSLDKGVAYTKGGGRAVLNGKKKCSGTSFPKKARGHSMCLTMVGGGWRLAVGGWRLAVGGWRLATGGCWRLAAVGGWRLVVPWGGP